MKASEFVRNKGFKTAKLIIDCWINYPETDVYLPDMMEYTFIAIKPTENCPFVSLDDLKRLVESHELVEIWGGLEYIDQDIQITRYPNRLKQAVLDVGSCL